MDLLSQRYASPFFVLDEFIRLGQLQDFVIEVFTNIQEEKEEKIKWEFYLHKVEDISYQDYVEGLEKRKTQEQSTMQKEDIKDIVNNSQALLDLFY